MSHYIKSLPLLSSPFCSAHIRELADAHHFSWGYWSFGPTFAIYDLQKSQWQPEILRALLPAISHT